MQAVLCDQLRTMFPCNGLIHPVFLITCDHVRSLRWCLDPGSNRDGPVRVRRIFLPATAFAAARSQRCTRSGSGARLHHRLRLRCPPSALYTFRPGPAAAWLGVASRCVTHRRGFSEFDGIHPARFRAGAQIDFKSAASANFAIEARADGSAAQEAGNKNASLARGDEEAQPYGDWRRGAESNRPGRICNPLHNRFATAPWSRSTTPAILTTNR